MIISRKKTNLVIACILIFMLMQFYGFVGFKGTYSRLCLMIAVFFIFVYSWNTYLSLIKSKIHFFVFLLTIAMFFSFINAYLFWGQDFLSSYRGSAKYMIIVFFFFLVKVKFSQNEVEKIIVFFSFVFVCFWILGLMSAPHILFDVNVDNNDFGLDDTRGLTRLRIPGLGFIVLGSFLSINKFIITKKKIWLFLFFVFYTVIFLQLTRQVILATALIVIIYTLKTSILSRIIAFFMVLIAPLCLLMLGGDQQNNGILGKLVSLSVSDFSGAGSGEQYIRFREYYYYIFDFPTNFITFIFGNGVPFGDSVYAKIAQKPIDLYQYYLSDIGYAQIYNFFGIFGLCLYFIIFYKALKMMKNRNIFYAKMFILYECIVGFTSNYILLDGIALSMSLYLLDTYSSRCEGEQ